MKPSHVTRARAKQRKASPPPTPHRVEPKTPYVYTPTPRTWWEKLKEVVEDFIFIIRS